MEILPIAVRTTAGVAGIWTLVLIALIYAIRTWPQIMQRRNEADGSLRADLLERISRQDAKIEAQDVLIAKERDDCLRQLARLEAQIQIIRHARNNADARFQALLMLLKRNPEDVAGAIRLIEEMVANQERAIATEKGAMSNPSLWSTNPTQAAAEVTVEAAKETLNEIKAEATKLHENGKDK